MEDVLESRLPYYAMEALWTGYQSRLSLLRMTLRGLRDSRWYMPATTSGAGPRPYALRCHHDGQVDSRPLSLLVSHIRLVPLITVTGATNVL